jgi:hypothetical protein
MSEHNYSSPDSRNSLSRNPGAASCVR